MLNRGEPDGDLGVSVGGIGIASRPGLLCHRRRYSATPSGNCGNSSARIAHGSAVVNCSALHQPHHRGASGMSGCPTRAAEKAGDPRRHLGRMGQDLIGQWIILECQAGQRSPDQRVGLERQAQFQSTKMARLVFRQMLSLRDRWVRLSPPVLQRAEAATSCGSAASSHSRVTKPWARNGSGSAATACQPTSRSPSPRQRSRWRPGCCAWHRSAPAPGRAVPRSRAGRPVVSRQVFDDQDRRGGSSSLPGAQAAGGSRLAAW